eukprot:TRINITY_DN726_c0_g1_i5.p1 TRINITY_DN726_c0_g1~~TRINITY_DN726_c0_g1_i5.p1  ORF type:complete len:173 (-),score=20.03 TRINITY_DN726_c0_g1_i5:215-733(-)
MVAIYLLFIFATYTSGQEYNNEEYVPPKPTIMEAAIGNQLTTFVSAGMASDLHEVLSNSSTAFTVFAPTNNAFESALNMLQISLQDFLKDIDMLNALLAYHIFPQPVLSSDLIDGMFMTSLDDDQLVVNMANATDGLVIEADQSEASVTLADITAGDSIIHIIDSVLLPYYI